MTKVSVKQFEEVFETDGTELSYRYHKANHLKDEELPIVKPIVSYNIWKQMYDEENSELNIYDFIIKHTDNKNVDILKGVERERFLDANPYYDINFKYIEECINKFLDYNNIELKFLTTNKLAEMYVDEMMNYGSVKDFLIDDRFVKELISKGHITLKLQSPFK